MIYDTIYYFRSNKELEDLNNAKDMIDFTMDLINDSVELEADEYDILIKYFNDMLSEYENKGLKNIYDINYLSQYEHLYDLFVIGDTNRAENLSDMHIEGILIAFKELLCEHMKLIIKILELKK